MDTEKLTGPPSYDYPGTPVTTTQQQVYSNPSLVPSGNNTTVYQIGAIVQQPLAGNLTAMRQPMVSYRDWNSSMCSCFDDLPSCCLVTCCYPFYLCHMFNQHNESACVPMCFPFPISLLRGKHRHRHGIHGTICSDLCSELWCAMCTLCQLKRDMDYVQRLGFVL